MSGRTVVVVLIVAAVLFSGVLAMHGKGHRAIMRWFPSIHGGR
jgi:hypothetical protein